MIAAAFCRAFFMKCQHTFVVAGEEGRRCPTAVLSIGRHFRHQLTEVVRRLRFYNDCVEPSVGRWGLTSPRRQTTARSQARRSGRGQGRRVTCDSAGHMSHCGSSSLLVMKKKTESQDYLFTQTLLRRWEFGAVHLPPAPNSCSISHTDSPE